jgi:two-component system sensor histidine kinase KdpD
MRCSFSIAAIAVPTQFPGPAEKRPFDWVKQGLSPLRQILEVGGMIGAVTIAGWFLPLSYHALGHIYLLAVIVLCLRVSRLPALVAAIVSGLAWNFVFIPPRLSFSVLDFDDGLLLGTYFVVALVAGQLTSRIRGQARNERQLKQRATALFHLTRALAGTRALEEAVATALQQANELFDAQSALLLTGPTGDLTAHQAGSYKLDDAGYAVAEWVWRNNHEAGRFTRVSPEATALHLPLSRPGAVLGVLVLSLPVETIRLTPEQRELLEAFAAQIALLVEREQLRAAGEREKLLAESERLHRTLLDSVSHELKTPLSVLRSAAENLQKEDSAGRRILTGEILTATRRLDRVVVNLLNQTRLESGAVKPQLDWCDVRDLLSAARRGLEETLADRPCKIEIPADMPLFMADAPLMEQVITNLLHNAAHHTPAGTPLLLTAGVDDARKRAFITIADRGPGLEPGLKERLFQKFHRGDGAISTGLGLGLSIVRGLMLAQGGDVEADNNAGAGASFTVYLPHTQHGLVPNE